MSIWERSYSGKLAVVELLQPPHTRALNLLVNRTAGVQDTCETIKQLMHCIEQIYRNRTSRIQYISETVKQLMYFTGKMYCNRTGGLHT